MPLKGKRFYFGWGEAEKGKGERVMTEHETRYAEESLGPCYWWACGTELESGEPIAWVRASYTDDIWTHSEGLTVMGPYDTAEEARAACQRIKKGQNPVGARA